MNTTLHTLLTDELRDLYDAEQQIISALPKMVSAASDESLRTSLEDHLEQTKGHVERLEEAAEELNFDLKPLHCAGMEGILKEGEKMLQQEATTDVTDLIITMAAAKVEHYEMSSYRSAHLLATTLGYYAVADLLQETLDEEIAAAEALEAAAEGGLFSTGLADKAVAEEDELAVE